MAQKIVYIFFFFFCVHMKILKILKRNQNLNIYLSKFEFLKNHYDGFLENKITKRKLYVIPKSKSSLKWEQLRLLLFFTFWRWERHPDVPRLQAAIKVDCKSCSLEKDPTIFLFLYNHTKKKKLKSFTWCPPSPMFVHAHTICKSQLHDKYSLIISPYQPKMVYYFDL